MAVSPGGAPYGSEVCAGGGVASPGGGENGEAGSAFGSCGCCAPAGGGYVWTRGAGGAGGVTCWPGGGLLPGRMMVVELEPDELGSAPCANARLGTAHRTSTKPTAHTRRRIDVRPLSSAL